MSNIDILIGTTITSNHNEDEKKQIRVKVRHTRFTLIGEKESKHTWKLFVLDQITNEKTQLQSTTTTYFSLLTTRTLKAPFDYENKADVTLEQVIEFINKIINKKHGIRK